MPALPPHLTRHPSSRSPVARERSTEVGPDAAGHRRTPCPSAWYPWLRPTVIAAVALAAGAVWAAWSLRNRVVLVGAGIVAAVALLAGPAAYAVTTISNSQTGASVAAGPGSGGGPGGGGEGQVVSARLIEYLQANQGDAKFLVAVSGSDASAPIIIATGEPVITIGGFGGRDPAPTLSELQALVADGQVRFIILGGAGGGRGGGGLGDLTSWVTANGTAVPASAYGSTGTGTLYDLAGLR